MTDDCLWQARRSMEVAPDGLGEARQALFGPWPVFRGIQQGPGLWWSAAGMVLRIRSLRGPGYGFVSGKCRSDVWKHPTGAINMRPISDSRHRFAEFGFSASTASQRSAAGREAVDAVGS